MDANYMSAGAFERVPYWRDVIDGDDLRGFTFDSLVVIPTKDIHESGFRCMDFVAIDKNGEPICRLSGISDVINLDGIGGYGKRNPYTEPYPPRKIESKSWSIDCLKESGFLRIFARDGLFLDDPWPLSSFELYAE